MAGPVSTYLATQVAAQTAFTVPFGLLTLVNGAIATATAAAQFNTTVDCSLFVAEDISNLRIYLDSLGYKVEFSKNATKGLLIDWSQALDVDGSSVTTVIANQGTPASPANNWPVSLVDAGGVNVAAVDATGDLQVDVRNFPATQPISAVSLPLPTGAATAANQINGSQAVKLVNGANTAAIDAAGDVSVDVNNFPATQAVSAVSLPLPAGAATAANQTNGSQAVKLVNGANTAAIDAAGDVSVDVNNFPATQAVSAVSLPLPTGAATAANQTNGTQETQIVSGANIAVVDATGDLQVDVNNFPVLQATNLTQISGVAITEGQKTMAASVPVVLASDQTGRSAILGVSTTGAAGAAVTLTIPAVAANFHYISYLEIVAYTTLARVGVAAPVIVTSTNLPGNPAWDFATAAAVGTTDRLPLNFVPPIHSSAANTPTTIVCPATTSVLWRVTVFYYAAV